MLSGRPDNVKIMSKLSGFGTQSDLNLKQLSGTPDNVKIMSKRSGFGMQTHLEDVPKQGFLFLARDPIAQQ